MIGYRLIRFKRFISRFTTKPYKFLSGKAHQALVSSSTSIGVDRFLRHRPFDYKMTVYQYSSYKAI